jgi:hypothetical protein
MTLVPVPILNFEDPTYSPDKFYTTARDDRTTIRANIDTGLYTAVTRWLQTNRFPEYRTFNDFLKDAVRHRIEYLQDKHPERVNDDEMWKVLDSYNRAAHLDQRAKRHKSNTDYVAALTEHCQMFLNEENWAELDGALSDAADGFDYLPDPFLGQVQDVIAKYRPYLNGRTWSLAKKERG